LENGFVPAAAVVAYEIKVTLIGIEPPIWRRLQVPNTMLMCCLHDAIQAVFGWTDSHLHQFQKDDQTWSDPEWFEDDDIDVGDESRVPVGRVLKAEGDSLHYEYDFGDNWRHNVVLERILVAESVPVLCLGGDRSCPPEDVGGVGGYEDFLEVLFDPEHEQFEHYRKWAGDGFWPERFDLKKVNETLSRMRWPKRHRRSS
jgi:hypothetical protein